VALLLFAVRIGLRDDVVYDGGLFLVVLGSTAIIGHVVSAPRSLLTRILAWAPLVWIGARSYGMYLLHLPVFEVVGATALGDQPGRVTAPIQIALTMLAAAASYRWIESPFMRRARLRGAPPHVQRVAAEA
jgi:peptidoglycan/LPS O-acetylase OafA/YrhL